MCSSSNFIPEDIFHIVETYKTLLTPSFRSYTLPQPSKTFSDLTIISYNSPSLNCEPDSLIILKCCLKSFFSVGTKKKLLPALCYRCCAEGKKGLYIPCVLWNRYDLYTLCLLPQRTLFKCTQPHFTSIDLSWSQRQVLYFRTTYIHSVWTNPQDFLAIRSEHIELWAHKSRRKTCYITWCVFHWYIWHYVDPKKEY